MPVITERDFPLLPSQAAKHQLTSRRGASGHARKPRMAGKLATLNDLPDELILEVLHYLPGIDMNNFQLSTLLSLALTSRRLYRVVIEKVYLSYDSRFCEPYLFLRTLISNPQLASFVRNLNMIQGARTHGGNVSYSPTAQDKKTIKGGMRALAVPRWKDWATDCNGDRITDDKVHNAILLHTPNITSLGIEDIAWVEKRCPAWFELISEASASTLSGHAHRFEHLRSINVDVRSATLTQIAPLFRLQALRHLQLRKISENGMGTCVNCDECHGEKLQLIPKLRRLIPEACNNLEKLFLEHTFYCMDVLEVLLSSPRQLKSFRYDVSLDHISEAYVEEDLTLITVLYHQRTSLENLDIFCDALAEEDTAGDIHLHDSHRSLADFTSLKHISCPLSMIAPVYSDPLIERLPPSLLTFQTMIRRHTDDHRSLGELEQLAAYLQTHTAQLKGVIVVAAQFAKWLRYDWERVVVPFSEAGIDFTIQTEYGEDDDFSDEWEVTSTGSSRSSDEVDLYSDEE